MGGNAVQILLRVGSQHCQHFRLPGGGAGDHAAIGVQRPAPTGLVHKGSDSFPAQLFRHSGIRGIRAAIYADDCAGGLKLAQQNRGLWLQYQTDGNTNA